MKEIIPEYKNIQPIPDKVEEIGRKIVDSAYRVHKKSGTGLLEKIYESCLVYELKKRGLDAQRQISIPIQYDGLKFDEGFVADVIVENKVIVEVKAVDKIISVWKAQILSHLKLTRMRLRFLINFNTINIGKGINRLVL
ncbi:GxxExxY protein [Rhodohalobacter sulfatireducens]|uniref:GxxExxY protein n=1 Tax=Rhodohalobacter sulfatireducens TaxID=2911366 RepID=A0ABS9KH75_9BACT|nr:GxxExxY protein [Rhodohalobacter sulfatireducens]MCG2590204.1 GxxExxY protein [Rhodohalobacter sulfatireducens]